MDPLITLVNPPTPVRLAGRAFLIRKLRPADYARLHAWIAARSVHPKLAAAMEMPAGLDDEARAERWQAAIAAAENWPPTPESPEGAALLRSPSGLVFTLRVLLGISHRKALALAAALEPGDFEALFAHVWPGDRHNKPAEAGGGPTMGWGEAYCALMKSYPGLTPDRISALSFDAIRLLLRNGEPEKAVSVPVDDISPEGLARTRERLRRTLLDELAEYRRALGRDDEAEGEGGE